MRARTTMKTRFGSIAVTSIAVASLGLASTGVASADTFIGPDPCLGTPADAPFADRSDISPVHIDNVDCLFDAEIFQGSMADGELVFNPAVAVTRGQMATLVVRALEHAGYGLPTSAEDAFDDDDGTSNEDNINIAASLGIVGGFSDGEFKANLPISRAQMASFLLRTAEVAFGSDFAAVTTNPYTDVPATSPHLDAIISITDVVGLTSGKGDGLFAPNAPTNRQEMASFTTRLVDLILLDATTPADDAGSGPLLDSEQRDLG